MIEVSLSSSQLYQDANVGVIRQVRNISDKRKPKYGAGDLNDWQIHIEGSCGEMVVSQYLNLYWDGNIGSLRANDVGHMEVRTRSKHHYDLIIHPDDKDEAKYILVTGINGSYQIHGWIYGKEGKQQKYWSDPAKGRPAYFVPKTELRSLETIFIGEADYEHLSGIYSSKTQKPENPGRIYEKRKRNYSSTESVS